MAKTLPKLPPSPEAKENALNVVRSHAAPLSVTALVKLLVPPQQIPAKDLEVILEEFVAAGALLRLPGKTPKAKPQYWDRDPANLRRASLLEAIEGALRASEIPLAAQDLAKQISGKPKAAELIPLVDELVASGSAFAMPVAGPKARPRFWSHPATEYGRQSLRKLLEAKGPQEETKLRSALKEFSTDQVRRIIDDALAEKELFRHPVAGKVKKELIGIRPASPEPYLGDIAGLLTKIVPQLLSAGVTRDDVRRYLVQVIEASGIPFSNATTSETTTAPGVGTESPSSGADLIALIRRLEPGADRGALVGARDLRRAARMEKRQFDRTVLDLAREGRVSLHYHDYPASLTPAEREELVTDGNGTFYVGVALRQNSL